MRLNALRNTRRSVSRKKAGPTKDLPYFLELRQGEVRLVLGPREENFSGSCIVTSRNFLIHIGATTATKSGCFNPKGVHQGILSGGWRCVEESLATANIGEDRKR